MATKTKTDGSQTQGQKWKPTPREIVGGIFVVLAIVFIAENGSTAKIRFVGPEVSAYLWLALLIAAAFGFVAGAFVTRRRKK